MNNQEQYDLGQLILLSLEGTLSADQFEQLRQNVQNDPDAMSYYMDYVVLYSNLLSPEIVSQDERNSVLDGNLWLSLAEEERIAPAVDIPKENSSPELIQKVVYPPHKKWEMSKFNIISFITSAAAILTLILFVKYAPTKRSSIEVATLVDLVNVKWARSDVNLKISSRLWTDEMPLQINEGIIKIKYDEGVDVVIEGPAIFKVDRGGIYLEYGRLFSRVPETGLGFTVKTPTSQFVDLGTEFGVQAEIDNSSELHVLKGKVQLFAGPKGRSKTGQMVTENKAVRYNANSDKIKPIHVSKNVFVRDIDSKTSLIWRGSNVNLADIVGGGNGFDNAGAIGAGVNLATGDPTLKSPFSIKKGHRRYLTVHENPFIDGIFVPDGETGPVTISSADHVFAGCPDTSGSFYWNIANGGQIRSVGKEDFRPLLMNRVEYGSKENPALIMHSNAGITFDLSAIQMQMPDISFSAFQGQCCISEGIPENPNAENPEVSIFVLVDGKVRFEKTNLSVRDGGIDINVPLDQGDRFLSFVVTDCSKDMDQGHIARDYCFIANPVLVVE